MSLFSLSQSDLENMKAIKSLCATRLENLKKDVKKFDLLSNAKLNAHITDLGSSWDNFTDCFIDFIYLVDLGLIKLKDFTNNEEFTLGYSDLSDIIEGFLQSKSETVEPIDTLQNNVKYNILSYLTQDISLDDYLNNKLYSKDLKTLADLITRVEKNDDEYNADVLKDIRSNSIEAIKNQYSETISKIKSILKVFYENTFGLYPYPAVFAYQGVAKKGSGAKMKSISLNTLVVPTKSDSTFSYKPATKSEAVYYDILANTLKTKNNISDISFSEHSEEYKTRFYNIDDILNCDINSFIYYPQEVFAFASRAILEARNDDMYKSSGINSYSTYEELIDVYIGDLLAKYIYKVMEKYGKTLDENDNTVNISFLSDDFREAYLDISNIEDKTEVYENYISGIISNVRVELNKFIRCICSAYVVSRNDSNDYFKVKLTDFNNVMSVEDTTLLFNNDQFTQNAEGVVFDNAIVTEVAGCKIYEYSFCKDAQLMDKKPLFGYTAAKLFQRQGQVISVDNILLGEDVTGAPLFASVNSPIYLGSRLCHRFSAGSRSGKGVMTMNILASSLASENVVFYVDRKPDIGSCLAAISNGQMFVVNGGDMNSSEDTFKVFSSSHKDGLNMLASYVSTNKSNYKRSYLTRVFGSDFGDTYEGAFGDFVYMKAMILTLGIIAARIHFMAKRENLISEGIDDLGMNRRVTVVLDEITNWHHFFEHAYFCTDASSSNLDKSAVKKYYKAGLGVELDNAAFSTIADTLSEDEEALFKAKQSAYEEAKIAWEQDKTDSKLLKAFESAKASLEKTLKSISAKSKASKDPKDLLCDLYWSTFMDKYKAFIDILAAYANAGFQEQMTTDNDVFFIGQFINGFPNLGDPINFNKDGSVRQVKVPDAGLKIAENIASEDKTRSYMLGFAEVFKGGCDWFIGRNIEDKDKPTSKRKNQFGGESLPQDLINWLHVRGNWGYISGGGQQQYRGGSPENVPENIVKLKPYLVLNTNDELSGASVLNSEGKVTGYAGTPYTSSEFKRHQGDKFKYIYGSANRVGFDDWEKIRLQHIKHSVDGSVPSESNRCYGKLEDGIGLKGLITEYKRTNSEFANTDFDASWLSTSGLMADRIVNRVSLGKYSTYQEYLFDMSPDAIICVDDIILAYSNETANLDADSMLKRRFPRYANTGNMSLLTSTKDSDLGNSALEVSDDTFNKLYEIQNNVEQEAQPVETTQYQQDNYTTKSEFQQPLSSVEAMRQQMMEDEDDWGDFDTEEEEVEEVPHYTAKNYTEADVESLAYQIFGKFTFNHPEIALKIQNPAMKGVVFENCIASARQVLFGGVM